MTNARPEPDLIRENTVEAMLFYLNYTLAAKLLKVSTRTVKRRMREYGYSIERLRELKAKRGKQTSIWQNP